MAKREHHRPHHEGHESRHKALNKGYKRTGLFDLLDQVRQSLGRLQDEVNLGDLGRLQEQFTGADMGAWKINLDYVDKGDRFELTADVPGMERDDLDIEVFDDYLLVQGERHVEREQSSYDYLRAERFTGQFARRVPLGGEIDAEAITAELDDGVLRVIVPKTGNGNARKVEIR